MSAGGVIVPTFSASIHAVNFEHVPAVTWAFGSSFALDQMAVSAGTEVSRVRRRGWW